MIEKKVYENFILQTMISTYNISTNFVQV